MKTYNPHRSIYRLQKAYDNTANHANVNPDIHIYLDGSGSLSDAEYHMPMMAVCFNIAKTHNVDIIFHSFSHYLEENETRISVKDKTLDEFKTIIRNTAKTMGGTEFELVWRYILEKDERKNEFSIIMSDMAYFPPDRQYNIENLYYLPIGPLSEWLDRSIADFIDAMDKHGMPIKDKMLI